MLGGSTTETIYLLWRLMEGFRKSKSLAYGFIDLEKLMKGSTGK